MSSRRHHLHFSSATLALAGLLLVSAIPALRAQSNTATANNVGSATTSTVTIRGHITDPTGALIPGAKVSVENASGKVVASTTADASGAYELRGLPAGAYVVKADFTGFASFQSQPISIAAGQAKRVDIAMAIQVEQQNVIVTDDSPTVNVEASGNANSIVLKGKDLDALSDDPDELSSELSALAGPSAGPNGGQIFIDGFSGGQLPPKSAIREIRINQNPFSAEFDRLGYGRIEILTKPGTDKLHGQVFMMGNEKSFNTGNPFAKDLPSYYSYMFNGTASGAISKSSSFFVSAERRNIGNVNAWLIPDAILPNGNGGFVEQLNYGVSQPNQRIRNNVSARIDWQLGARNTFTARYGFWSEAEHGNLNAGSLPTATTHESNTEHNIQISDAITINDHMVNETRLEFERQNENHYPDSIARTISVMGEFTTGGYTGQVSRDHATHIEFQNLTTMSHGSHAIKFGTRMRDNRDANYTTSNYNGSFVFDDPAKYLAMANGLAQGQSFNSLVAQGYGPIQAAITTGPSSAVANMFDVALFVQDDWKVNQRLTMSGGLRWESQNHIADHNDWAPRVALAYALDGSKGKQAKTVVRAGYGVFYDRFGVNNLMTIQHLGADSTNRQTKIVLNNPTCTTSASSLDAIQLDTSNCQSNGTASNPSLAHDAPVKYLVAPHFHSPYISQAGASIERQITKTTNATVTYLHSFGPHQLVTINANQYDPARAAAGENPYPLDSTGGYMYEFFPEGVFTQNQVITSVNGRVGRNLTLVGFYTLGFADSNGGAGSNISNAYNLRQDYGPATFVSRHQIFSMASYNGPWGLRFNPFLVAQSGRPFNITLPDDPINNFYNQRPGLASTAQCNADPSGTRYVSTVYGCLDRSPVAGEPLIAPNKGVGPAAVAVNLRVSRGFGFGPETGGTSGPGGHGPGGPPDGGGHRGGPPGGGLGPGGLGGGPGAMRGMFGGGAPNRKYTLTFSAQALNLFNNIDYGGPNGTLGSRSFNRSTTLAGGIFSTGSAARRIFLQAIFSF